MRIPKNYIFCGVTFCHTTVVYWMFFIIFFSSCFFIRVTHNHINHLIGENKFECSGDNVSVL